MPTPSQAFTIMVNEGVKTIYGIPKATALFISPIDKTECKGKNSLYEYSALGIRVIW